MGNTYEQQETFTRKHDYEERDAGEKDIEWEICVQKN